MNIEENGLDERLPYITAACEALCHEIGRPLRVLDLGCVQGTQAEDTINTLRHDEYDLVLGLDVFDALHQVHGMAAVQYFIRLLAERIPAGIFAIPQAAPEHVRSLLSDFAFVHEIANTSNTISEHSHPLFFASNHFWYLAGDCRRIKEWKMTAHELSPQSESKMRRHYIGETAVAKVYSTLGNFGSANSEDIQKEADVLEAIKALPTTPLVRAHGSNGSEAWLVRDLVPGTLLLDAIAMGMDFDQKRVIGDVLDQLCRFEEAGLFHNDLRIWNVVLRSDGGASIIDFSSLQTTPQDACWPFNLFFVFWIFTWGVTNAISRWDNGTLPPAMSPANIPLPYRTWSRDFWQREMSSWSFRALRESYGQFVLAPETQRQDDAHVTTTEAWMMALEVHAYQLQKIQRTHSEVALTTAQQLARMIG